MRTQNSGGDSLARGAVRFTFRPPDVSKERYDEATQDFDLEKFLGKKSSGDTDSESTGTTGVDAGEVEPITR
jgi:hypothetical protein